MVTLAAVGCGPAMFGQTDDFPDKLKAGCPTSDRCEVLVTEARARVERCQPSTVGYIPCSDAKADLTLAESMLARVQRFEKEQADRQRERQTQAEQRERQWQLERQEREEKARREQQEIGQAASAAQQEIAAQEQAEAAEKTRLTLLGKAGREKELRQCYAERRTDCRDLLARLLPIADSEAEQKKLVALDQKLAGAALESGLAR